MMSFRHLDYPEGTSVSELGPAAIDGLLDRGDLEAWAPLASAIRADPFGDVADTVLRLCDAHPMYGTSALWREWIERLRAEERGISLAELRRRRGATQAQVAERMGMSQSDASKLERRGDMRLSTLTAYIEAMGGELRLVVIDPTSGETFNLRPFGP